MPVGGAQVNPLTGMQYRVTDQGIVNGAHETLARILAEHFPSLEVQWIPPAVREAGDKPFRIVHNLANGYSYPVMYLDESEMDHRVLARIACGDLSKSNNRDLISWAEAEDGARKMFQAQQRQDAVDEAKELAESIIKSNLHTYKHGGKVYR